VPERPPVACKVCGSGDCANKEHASQSSENRRLYDNVRKANDPIAREYHLAKWLKHFQPTVIAFNPVCQRIIKGVRCQNPATRVHHLISPRQVHSLFYNPRNCVCVCPAHHAGGQQGETQGAFYAPTRWHFGVEFPHIDSFGQPILPDDPSSGNGGIDNWLKSLTTK
jgi:hypothetical protein